MTLRPATSATAAALRAQFGTEPWSYADALAIGITRGRIRAALSAGHLRGVRHGVYAVAPAADLDVARAQYLARLRAHLQATDGAVASHRSALLVHRLPDPWARGPAQIPDVVELTLTGSTGWRARGLRVHGCPLATDHRTDVDGTAVTTMSRTAMDVSRRLGRPRALIVSDAACRRMLLREADHWIDTRRAVMDDEARSAARAAMHAVCEWMEGWPWVRSARWAAENADPAAESPMESLSRAQVLLAGLPAPAAGRPVQGDDGTTYWGDLVWEGFRVIGEADGRLKYDDPEALYAEKRREDSLRRAGWIVVRWTWDELVRRPEVVIERIRRALLDRGWRP